MDAPNILTEQSKIDSRKHAVNKGFLLPYQLDWVFDESRCKLCEKSVRIGITFAQEFASVRGRLATKDDYLHGSVTQGVAMNYIRECEFWVNQYKIKGTSMGEMDFIDELDNNTLKRALFIEFPNGSRIISFSSSPNAMRGFGGDVGLDEIAFHRAMAAMIKGAGTRSLWGDSIAMWSSHCGADSDFNQFIKREKAKGDLSKWSMHKITIIDAINQGLVEKINEVKGTDFTREGFLEDCEAACGSREAFEEECMCEPQEGGERLVSWFDVQACQDKYPIYFTCIEGDAKGEEIDPSVQALMNENPFLLLDKNKRYSYGYDIARNGHLSSMIINETDGRNHRTVMLILLHKCKFASQRELQALALDTHRGLTGSGDATGLGMESAEILSGRFPYRYTGVNFGAFKPHLGSKLKASLEDHRIIIPEEPDIISYDIRSVGTMQSGTKVIYTASRNPVDARSHSDIAWSMALAITDAEDGEYSGSADALEIPNDSRYEDDWFKR